MRRRVSCPVMIGRSAELDRLREALAQAAAGSPHAVIVSGEAGIGKTRLVREFAAAAPPEVRVLWGGCVPLADGLLPYAPVVELLRPLSREIGWRFPAGLDPADHAALRGFLPYLAGGSAAGAPAEAD